MNDEFELSEVTVNGDLHVVVVRGEIDLFGAPELKRKLSELIDRGIRRVVIDLSETVFLDSTAVSVVLGALRRLRSRGGELAIVDLSAGSSSEIFRVTGLDQIVTVVPTRSEALAALAVPPVALPPQDGARQ
jgi:anti-sigma B factor antagonist